MICSDIDASHSDSDSDWDSHSLVVIYIIIRIWRIIKSLMIAQQTQSSLLAAHLRAQFNHPSLTHSQFLLLPFIINLVVLIFL